MFYTLWIVLGLLILGTTLTRAAPGGPITWIVENSTDSGARWVCKDTARQGSLIRDCYVTFKGAGNESQDSSLDLQFSTEKQTEPQEAKYFSATTSRFSPETLLDVIYWMLKGRVDLTSEDARSGEPAPFTTYNEM
jgi:hypothetical protein